MSSSPDAFHYTRVQQANTKAAAIGLQLAEYRAHRRQVDEYRLEMFRHLVDEDAKCRSNLYLILQQPEINLLMRPDLLGLLMNIINRLNLSKSTFPLTVGLVDRYCLKRVVRRDNYQLLGVTALWISCKNLDLKYRVPTLLDLSQYCNHHFEKKMFLDMERHILNTLEYVVNAPTFDAFIDMYIHALHQSPFLAGSRNHYGVCNDVKIVAIYICEIITFYPNVSICYTQPQYALLSVVLACLMLDVGPRFSVSAFLNHVAKAAGEPMVTEAEYSQAFGLLLHVVKAPPELLILKYFREDSRYAHLMNKLLGFTKRHLARNLEYFQTGRAPNTAHEPKKEAEPKALGITTPMYPATPVSLTMSPKAECMTRPVLAALALCYTVLPTPSTLPPEMENYKKRSFGEGPALKRTKSEKTTFYIH